MVSDARQNYVGKRRGLYGRYWKQFETDRSRTEWRHACLEVCNIHCPSFGSMNRTSHGTWESRGGGDSTVSYVDCPSLWYYSWFSLVPPDKCRSSTDVFHDFPQPVQTKTDRTPQIRPRPLPSASFEFIILSYFCIMWAMENGLNKQQSTCLMLWIRYHG
jgi:hypothetical protein